MRLSGGLPYYNAFLNSTNNTCCLHISFSFCISKRLPLEGKVAERQRGRMRCYRNFNFTSSVSFADSFSSRRSLSRSTIILQITMLLFVKGEDLYCKNLLFHNDNTFCKLYIAQAKSAPACSCKLGQSTIILRFFPA